MICRNRSDNALNLYTIKNTPEPRSKEQNQCQ